MCTGSAWTHVQRLEGDAFPCVCRGNQSLWGRYSQCCLCGCCHFRNHYPIWPEHTQTVGSRSSHKHRVVKVGKHLCTSGPTPAQAGLLACNKFNSKYFHINYKPLISQNISHCLSSSKWSWNSESFVQICLLSSFKLDSYTGHRIHNFHMG